MVAVEVGNEDVLDDRMTCISLLDTRTRAPLGSHMSIYGYYATKFIRTQEVVNLVLPRQKY